MVWKPKTFKMRYFPGDSCDIFALCDELTRVGVVVLYGDGLAYIPGFEKHQHVNPRETESDLPNPDGWVDPGPKKVGKTLREAVFERDGHRCVRCGSTEKLEPDHILPQSAGGPHIIENLRTLCKKCNAGRPVSGQALIDDLAKDGFTIESLRVKFGIDASISVLHTQGGREGKGRNTPHPPKGLARFADFWDAWPKSERKGGRAKCEDVWAKGGFDSEADAIVAHVKAMADTEGWRKEAGRYVPAPLVYLNGRRWDGADLGQVARESIFEGAI
jgi:hypothetical protein